MVGYKLSKNDWVTPFFVIFRSVREILLVTVFFDHPVLVCCAEPLIWQDLSALVCPHRTEHWKALVISLNNNIFHLVVINPRDYILLNIALVGEINNTWRVFSCDWSCFQRISCKTNKQTRTCQPLFSLMSASHRASWWWWKWCEIKDEIVVLSCFYEILTEFKNKNVTCINWENKKNLCMHPLKV